MSIYEPSRGGTRGGKDQFVWEDVKSDKYRENYLAHSLMAPVGRWQKGRDLTWYTKESKVSGRKEALQKEVAAIKQAEEEAMARALGHKLPVKKTVTTTGQLSKREMIDVCKRRVSEGNSTDVTGRERIEGMGYKSQRTAVMMGGGAGPSEEGVTSFESDQTKTEDRLILRRTSERERISSISSDQPSLIDTPTTSSSVIHKEVNQEEISKKEKKRNKHKHKKEKKKKSKKEKKSSDKHTTTRKHKRREATPTSDTSSDEEEYRKERRYNSNKSSHDRYSRPHKRTRHDSDSSD